MLCLQEEVATMEAPSHSGWNVRCKSQLSHDHTVNAQLWNSENIKEACCCFGERTYALQSMEQFDSLLSLGS